MLSTLPAIIQLKIIYPYETLYKQKVDKLIKKKKKVKNIQ